MFESEMAQSFYSCSYFIWCRLLRCLSHSADKERERETVFCPKYNLHLLNACALMLVYFWICLCLSIILALILFCFCLVCVIKTRRMVEKVVSFSALLPNFLCAALHKKTETDLLLSVFRLHKAA